VCQSWLLINILVNNGTDTNKYKSEENMWLTGRLLMSGRLEASAVLACRNHRKIISKEMVVSKSTGPRRPLDTFHKYKWCLSRSSNGVLPKYKSSASAQRCSVGSDVTGNADWTTRL
jgi:hypothetical protein